VFSHGRRADPAGYQPVGDASLHIEQPARPDLALFEVVEERLDPKRLDKKKFKRASAPAAGYGE
jgi:hypothetical protein